MEPTTDSVKLRLIAELVSMISDVASYRCDNMTRHVLVEIEDERRRLPKEARSWGFWVREYAPISVAAYDVDFRLVPERVWFFDRSGMRKENVWSWMRYVAAKTLAPEKSATRLFPIGLTAFAPYKGSDDYYVEVLWGGLWGEAWRISWGSEGQMFNKELWPT